MMAVNRRRILFLLVCLIALLLAVGAYAMEEEFEPIPEGAPIFLEEPEAKPDAYEASGSYSWLTSSQADELVEHIYKNVKNAALTIDVSKFKIPINYFSDTREAWREMVREHRDVEYYASPFTPGGSADGSGKYVGTLDISSYKGWNDDDGTYSISVSTILSINAAVDKKVDEIVSAVPSEMSDLEKVLYIHDWLCVNGEYDLTGSNGGITPRTSYDIRGILLYEIGVCQSYTWTFDYIMDRFGIPCINVTSDSMNHTWNQVQVGGYWYNMDITWDDPTKNLVGRARHEYFLCSDSDFKSKRDHDGYYDGVSCYSTKYDSAFWKDVDTPMPYYNGETYYLRQTESGRIKAIDIDTMSSARTVYTVADGWRYYYTQSEYDECYFTCLAIYNGMLYFNVAETIAYVKLDGTGYTVLKNFSTSDSSQVYGMYIKNSNLYYGYGDKPSAIPAATGSLSLFIPITSIKLPFANGKMPFGYYAMIEATVNAGADASRIIWSSSNTSVATIEAGGKVYGKGYGTTVITATSPDSSSVKATMSLTVYADITSIAFVDAPSDILKGSAVTLNLKLNEGALASDVVWASDNSNVLTVSNSGALTTVGYGTATITAKSSKDPSIFASVKLRVYEKITSISLENNSKTMYKGTQVTLKADLNEGARREDIKWSASNPAGTKVLKVDSTGTVTLLDVGTAIVIASSPDGSVQTMIRITVEDAMPGDPNGDGIINATDSVIMAQFLAGWTLPYDMSIADVNCDGKVNATDAVIIAQYLAGWNVTLGPKMS